MLEGKRILDACCGGRQFWFNKSHPETLYIDIRRESKGCLPIRPNFEVQPDKVMDFRDLGPIPDKQFKLIIWDPPHIKTLGETSIMRKKYGALNTETWVYDLGKGFDELWRVLDDYGTLVFKWNETEIPLKTVLKCFKQRPILGHPTAKSGKTIWILFFKSKRGDGVNSSQR